MTWQESALLDKLALGHHSPVRGAFTAGYFSIFLSTTRAAKADPHISCHKNNFYRDVSCRNSVWFIAKESALQYKGWQGKHSVLDSPSAKMSCKLKLTGSLKY